MQNQDLYEVMVDTEKKTRSELKREAIVEAARRAFQSHGVQGASMDLIAEQAQVSKRTVYNHFATKEALVTHLVSELWRTAMVDAELKYEADEPLLSQLQTLLMAEIEVVGSKEYVELSRMVLGHYLYRSDELQSKMEAFNAEETVLLRWIKQAKGAKRLSSEMDVDFAFQQIHGLVKGAAFWPQFVGSDPELSNARKTQLATETALMFLARYEN